MKNRQDGDCSIFLGKPSPDLMLASLRMQSIKSSAAVKLVQLIFSTIMLSEAAGCRFIYASRVRFME